MKLDFEGLNVVVTGGRGALGWAVVARLLACGANCHVPDLAEREEAEEVLPGEVEVAWGVDLACEKSVVEYFASLPPLWASIHCAGGFSMGEFSELSAEDWQGQLEMNLKTCFLSSREAIRNFRKHETQGRIVNVSSRPGVEPREGSGMVAYTVAKAGVASLTQSLGEELAEERIWVNAVAPSIIDTPANRSAMPDADFSTWPNPEEIAATICFLASPENKTVRGSVTPVYGSV